MSSTAVIGHEALVERKAPDLPRYVIVPAHILDAWQLHGTTPVKVELDGAAIGRRNLKRWDGERWFIDLTAAQCARAGVDTGARVRLRLWRAPNRPPDELEELIAGDEAARRTWSAMTPSQQRRLGEHVRAAKRPQTRRRRASVALLPGGEP